MTQPSEPIFDSNNPHVMADDRVPLILQPGIDTYELPDGRLALTLAGLLRIPGAEKRFKNFVPPPPDVTLSNQQIIEGSALAGTLDPADLVVPISFFVKEGKHSQPSFPRSVREVIKQIIPLIPVDTPNPEDDFTELKSELEKFTGLWFAAPEAEMPLWIGLATTLEDWFGEPQRDWPDWKRQVLAIFTGSAR